MYADGVYDVFHAGHSRQLMQAKNMFPNVTLMAGCHSDKATYEIKGQTVCTEEERYEAVRHCRYVDILIPDVPFFYSLEFYNKYKIDFIAHDDMPYNMGGAEGIILSNQPAINRLDKRVVEIYTVLLT